MKLVDITIRVEMPDTTTVEQACELASVIEKRVDEDLTPAKVVCIAIADKE
jgi:hypothetical protein